MRQGSTVPSPPRGATPARLNHAHHAHSQLFAHLGPRQTGPRRAPCARGSLVHACPGGCMGRGRQGPWGGLWFLLPPEPGPLLKGWPSREAPAWPAHRWALAKTALGRPGVGRLPARRGRRRHCFPPGRVLERPVGAVSTHRRPSLAGGRAVLRIAGSAVPTWVRAGPRALTRAS